MQYNDPNHPVSQMQGLVDGILHHHANDLSPTQQQQLQGYQQHLSQNGQYYQQNPDQMQGVFNGIVSAAAPFIINYGINAILNRGAQGTGGGGYMPAAGAGGYMPAAGAGGYGGGYPSNSGLGGLISGALPGIIAGLTGGSGTGSSGGGLGGILGGSGAGGLGGILGGTGGGGFGGPQQPPSNQGGQTTL